MKKVQASIQKRLSKYFENKMRPILKQMIREQAELMMVEGIRYMKEIIYLIWIVFSIA